ncbi:hypothetical protein BDA99DRAFT_523188 [Phascolomyces articulosus]|uniref:Uncharacterized protein n=1 Tax=Phascolomyces articulosus TaxID=60185 RepID=A0AAD5P9F2_9FUNG|nr:hypothetical protein BDA99DRAFT_523188 [Phascolomyces articulosus]
MTVTNPEVNNDEEGEKRVEKTPTTIKEVIEAFIQNHKNTTNPSLDIFINAHYKDIISVAPVYKDWTSLASSIKQQFIETLTNECGKDISIKTTYSKESWETVHNAIKARAVHKNASLQLITTAANTNTSELQQALNHGKQASQESDDIESPNQKQKRHIIDDHDDFHNKRFRQDDENTVDSLLFEANRVIPRILVESSTPQWSVDYENVFWKNWFDLLESEKGIHVYDLINYGVIECGYKINCRPNFNQALYNELGLVKSSTTIVKENRDYIKRCIKKMKESNGDFLYAINDTSDLPSTSSAKLVSTIFQQFSRHIFSKSEHDVDKYETTYNYRIVWPCIDAAVDSISNKKFKALPGEINMKAFSTLDSEYKADGLCFFNGKEILVLETSGPYNNGDDPRHAYDHIKGAFGLLAMFRSFVNLYHHADLNTLQQLRLWFLHARGDSMHLWALQMPAANIFILERIAKAIVPIEIKDSYYINSVFELFWILKSGLEETGKTLALLEKSHDDYMEEELFGDIQEGDKREDLRKTVATKVVKPVRGSGYGPLLPKSYDVSFSDSISTIHPNQTPL